MVWERLTFKDGKFKGVYNYESFREGKKVRQKYLGINRERTEEVKLCLKLQQEIEIPVNPLDMRDIIEVLETSLVSIDLLMKHIESRQNKNSQDKRRLEHTNHM